MWGDSFRADVVRPLLTVCFIVAPSDTVYVKNGVSKSWGILILALLGLGVFVPRCKL
jgi:hypothetical protein